MSAVSDVADEADDIIAEEREADIRDRLDRAGALGRHLHAYYDDHDHADGPKR